MSFSKSDTIRKVTIPELVSLPRLDLVHRGPDLERCPVQMQMSNLENNLEGFIRIANRDRVLNFARRFFSFKMQKNGFWKMT